MAKSLPFVEIPDRPDLYPDGMKFCSKCGERKSIVEFRVANRHLRLGIRNSHCRICCSNAGMERKKAKANGMPPKSPADRRKEIDGKKPCSRCGEMKDLDEFYLVSSNNGKPNLTGRRTSHCRVCVRDISREWTKRNPERSRRNKKRWVEANPERQYLAMRNGALRRKYGITLKEYDLLRQKQNNRCLICERSEDELGKQLVVDHDHETGDVRGLLCNACNMALGAFADDKQSLSKAIIYLERNKS